ncbi:hypothetical protein PTKIN_Ptkin10aG0185600 [Pterospermum kingtungense]
MSARVDIWSNESAKSNGSSPNGTESSKVVGSQEKSSTEVAARAFVSSHANQASCSSVLRGFCFHACSML